MSTFTIVSDLDDGSSRLGGEGQLKFSTGKKLYGRQEELDRLHTLFQSISSFKSTIISPPTQLSSDLALTGDKEELVEEEEKKDDDDDDKEEEEEAAPLAGTSDDTGTDGAASPSSSPTPVLVAAPIPTPTIIGAGATKTDDSNEEVDNIVLVSGYSGTGKSALVSEFLKQIQENQAAAANSNNINESSSNQSCFIMKGKFQELQNADPFSAFVEAVGSWCSNLLKIKNEEDEDEDDNEQKEYKLPEELVQLQSSIQQAVGEEGKILTDLVPELSQLLGPQPDLLYPSDSKENEWNRLVYVVTNFMRSICSYDHPVVLFLDDLQWADQASLNLLCNLLTNESTSSSDNIPIHHFLFVGSYRSNEVVQQTHHLSIWINKIQETYRKQHHHQGTTPTTTVPNIVLENLSEKDLGMFISDMLHLELDETESLTRVVYHKTHGNMFYAIQSLEQLYRIKALHYSLASFKWEWNLERVEEELGISVNVADMVVSKIQSLPPQLQRALTIAAFLRSSFDAMTLLALIQALHQEGKVEGEQNDNGSKEVGFEVIGSFQELIQLLDMAVLVGLLDNSVGSTRYKFAHDRIQKAAYSLVSRDKGDEAQEALQLKERIGMFLVERSSSSNGQDWMLFVAADHLNSVAEASARTTSTTMTEQPNNTSSASSSGTNLDPLTLARINFQVGEKAIAVSAFLPASQYFEKSRHALDRAAASQNQTSPWESNYDLTLRLYRASADIELCLGHFEIGKDLSEIVLERAVSLDDKLPTYVSLADGLGQSERHMEALELNKTTLELLGAFPKWFQAIQTMSDMRGVGKLFKAYSDEQFLDLPLMQDKNKLVAMEILTKLSVRAFICGKMIIFLLCVFIQIKMTFKYGIAPQTAQALAAYGTMLCGSFGDPAGGSRMGKLARQVLKRTKAKHMEAIVLVTVASFIDAWSLPLPKILESFQEAYRSGMQSGDLENGFRGWGACHFHAYAAGFPLDTIEQTGANLLQQLEQYQMDSIRLSSVEHRLVVLHLMGRVEYNPKVLEDIKVNLEDSSEDYRLIYAYLSRLQIAYYFGDFELAERMSTKLHAISGSEISYIVISLRLYFTGLMATTMYRKTGKYKYKTLARKATNEMKNVMKARGINVLHKYLLLQADFDSCFASNSQKNDVKAAYEKAIAVASKAGFTQDAALANELAGEYSLRIQDDYWTSYYFTCARNLYEEWGAKAKVSRLMEQRGSYMETRVSSMRRNSALSSRHWVSGEGNEMHKSVNFNNLTGVSSSSAASGDSISKTATDSRTKSNPELECISDKDISSVGEDVTI